MQTLPRVFAASECFDLIMNGVPLVERGSHLGADTSCPHLSVILPGDQFLQRKPPHKILRKKSRAASLN